MQILFPFRDQLFGAWDSAKSVLAEGLEQMAGSVHAAFTKEHAEDGGHTTINATGNVIAGGYSTFSGQPRLRIFKLAAVAQTITTGTDTFVQWTSNQGSNTDPEEYDYSNQFDGTDAVVCSTAGLYLVIADIGWDVNATGKRKVSVYTDVALGVTASVIAPGDAVAGPTQLIVCPVYVASNVPDKIRIQVFQDSGVNRTVSGWISVLKLF